MVLVKSKFSMRFGGVELMQWIDGVTNIDRNIGQNRTTSLLKVTHTNGERFQYTTASHGTITVTALIFTDIHRRELAQALMSDEPQQLIFGDEPDKYYLAIVDGQSTVAEAYYNNILTITFVVPDGIAHSVATKTADNTTDTITVPNLGTAPTAPIISATMHSENGLVAFANDQGGVLQFGDPEEIDGETRQKSERVLYEGYDHAPADVTYNNAATNYPNYLNDPAKPNSQRGTIGYADTVGLDPAKGSGATPTFTNGDSGYWGGPSYQLAINPSSNNTNTGNFLMKTRFYFATSVKQTGRLEITLQNGDEVAYSAVIRDSETSKDEIDVEFWVQSKCMDSFALNRKNYTNGMYRELVIGKLGSKITMQIGAVTDIKTGNTTTVRSTVIKNYQLDYMADVPVTTYSVWFERMRNMNHVVMDVTDTQFSWVNVNYWQDLPNRWNDGDVVTADVANKAIYVNGVEDMTLHTVGNQWDKFMLQPGENTIEAIGSSWCTTPLEVSVQYREAYY